VLTVFKGSCPTPTGDGFQAGWPPVPSPTPKATYPGKAHDTKINRIILNSLTYHVSDHYLLISVPPKYLYKIVPGALVFPTRRAMLQVRI
jgi:hypothetical protein